MGQTPASAAAEYICQLPDTCSILLISMPTDRNSREIDSIRSDTGAHTGVQETTTHFEEDPLVCECIEYLFWDNQSYMKQLGLSQ